MDQDTHTAINNLYRNQVQSILEGTCGMAVYDDEPTTELRDCLRGEADGSDEYSAEVRLAIDSQDNQGGNADGHRWIF